MIDSKIKVYKNLIEVNITDFNGTNEIMYWEGELKDFSYKYQTEKAMCFPIHGGKVIAMQRVQGFDNAKGNDITLQHMISGLDDLNKKTVQIKVNNYTKDHNVYPSQKWINNLIERLVYPNKAKEDEAKKYAEGEKVRQKKVVRINFFKDLSKEKQKDVEGQAWKKTFTINANYKENKHNIKAKILFNKYRNEILDDLIKLNE